MEDIRNITILTQKRDRERVKRLRNIGLSKLEILRAGLKTWEDRKLLKPYIKSNKI